MRMASTAAILIVVAATSGVAWANDPLPSTDPDPARQQYEREFIGFHDVDADGGYFESFAYQGKYQRPLDTPAFLDAVDQPELAARYRRATTLRRALVLPGSLLLMAGGATAVTGGVMWGMGATCSIAQRSGGTCDTSAAEAATWVGVGAVAAGLVLDIAGALIPQPSIEPYQMRQMADEHNQRLLRRLGLVSSIGPTGAMVGVRVALE